MPTFRRKATTIAAACAVSVFAACGDSSGPVEEAQDFTGSYTLVTFYQGTAATVTEIPGATGTFTMTATTYAVSTTIPTVPTPTVVNDHGTYTALGTATSGTFAQQSTDNPDLQYSGTYSWDATTNRLTIDTTSQSIRTVLVIQRT